MDAKAYAKAAKPLHKAVGATVAYLEAEAAGVRVLAAAANLAARAATWQRLAAAVDADAADAATADGGWDAGSGATPLAPFSDAPRLLAARHGSEVRKQLAQLPHVVDAARSAAAAVTECAGEVADATRRAAGVGATLVYVSTALPGGGGSSSSSGGGSGSGGSSGGGGGGVDVTPECPLDSAALVSLARSLASIVNHDCLSKSLLAASFIDDPIRIGGGDDDDGGGDGDGDGDGGSGDGATARLQWAAHVWASGATAVAPDSDVAASLPPAPPPSADDDGADSSCLAPAWRRVSDAVWRFSGATLEEHLLARAAAATAAAAPDAQ